MSKRTQHDRVKLLVCILGRENEIALSEVANEFCVSLTFSTIGFGTAKSHYMSYLGLDEIEKRVVYALFPSYVEKPLMRSINKRLKLYLMGKGIAFTIPLSGISNIIARSILTPQGQGIKENGTISPRTARLTEKERKKMHEIIVAVVDQKFTEVAVDAARSAGATGATMLHTRSLNNAQAEQLIGTSFSQETDTLLFLTTEEYKTKIMEAIRDAAGLKTEGGAIIFSLPVDSMIGIGRFEEE